MPEPFYKTAMNRMTAHLGVELTWKNGSTDPVLTTVGRKTYPPLGPYKVQFDSPGRTVSVYRTHWKLVIGFSVKRQGRLTFRQVAGGKLVEKRLLPLQTLGASSLSVEQAIRTLQTADVDRGRARVIHIVLDLLMTLI
ncbi:MAG: hypothetical protein GC129_07385 [Proteobacteria bacterium]|nr:hypothetical protein [Pseudomonadota bacterium]